MTPVLSLNNLHFSRPIPNTPEDDPTAFRTILQDVSWEVSPGQLAAVLGPNGCGKSTLLRIATGYLWPHSGTVQLLGQTLGTVPTNPLRAKVGILEASTIYPFDDDMTAADVAVSGYYSALTLGYLHPTPDQYEHARHLLEQVGLKSKFHQLYHTLSTGERLRALLARALVRTPALLLLDEPTAGLDLPARESLLATLARLHRSSASRPAIVTVTHHLEELLPDTQNVLLLSNRGSVIAHGPAEKVLTDDNMSHAYNVPIQISIRNGRYSAHVDPKTWDELL